MSDTVPVRELWYINKKKLLNRAIAAATWLPNPDTEPVSHCEIWEPDAVHGFMVNHPTSTWLNKPAGQCWTSTTRGDANGTVVRPAAGVLDHPGNWYCTEHRVDKIAFRTAQAKASYRVAANKGYSWRDLSRYVMPLWMLKKTGMADNGREICSEHVESWLVDMGILTERLLRSPRRLCKHTVLATGSPLRRLVDDSIVRDGQWKKQNGIIAK